MATYRFFLVNCTLHDRETGKSCHVTPEHAQRFTDAIMGTDTSPAQSPDVVQAAMGELLARLGA